MTFMWVATMTLLAVVIAGLGLFVDLTDLSRRAQLLSIVAAGILGVIAGLPWDDMAELFAKLVQTWRFA